MFAFVLRRVALIVPTFIGVTLLAFALIRLIPGDPVENLSGERGMDPERRLRLLHQFGLDKPLYAQYFDYLGRSLQRRPRHVADHARAGAHRIPDAVPGHVELAFFALIFAVCIGLPAGILAAIKRNTVADYAVMGVSLTGYSMPIFWWALLLILLLLGAAGLDAGVGPHRRRSSTCPTSTGFMLIDTLRSGDPGAFRSAVSHLILPSIALGTIPLAVIARMTRSSMLEVLREDYVRTARAKGLPRLQVVFVHALRNALIPVITVIGLQVGLLLSGRHPHRDDLLLAGHRQLADPRRAVARLSGRAGRHPADRGAS